MTNQPTEAAAVDAVEDDQVETTVNDVAADDDVEVADDQDPAADLDAEPGDPEDPEDADGSDDQ
jgi:hypothetical protein